MEEKGLTSEEAKQLLEKFGPNELKKEADFSSWKLFLNQFKSPLIYILVAAGIVTAVLADYSDAVVIFIAVVLNTILGFYQENKAQKSLAALKSLLAPRAKVIRDGEQKVIEAKEVVVGDMVVLAMGDRVPADGLLISATDLTVNEAILTGESGAVGKAESRKLKAESNEESNEDRVFMGTTVVTGIAKMRVEKTGRETEIGKIGEKVSEIEEEATPLQKQLGKLAKNLAILVGVMTVLIFILGEIRGYDFLEMLTVSVAVAVSAIPEGLAVTLTVILTLGMRRILKRKALVRKLLAAETLGSVSTICVDKTGTLTEGKMRVVKSDFIDENLGVLAAILCNDMRDPLEVAMREFVQLKAESRKLKAIIERYPRLEEIPFNPKEKYMATLHEVLGEEKNLLLVSGAPEIILRKVQSSKFKVQSWEQKLEEYGGLGYRLVGFAYKKTKASKIEERDLKELEWLGILIYEDPVREGVSEALEECRKAGLKVKVITGDYLATALAVLKKLKMKNEKLKTESQFQGREENEKLEEILADGAITGEELAGMTEEELRQVIGGVGLFARINPEQKLKIVQALKDNGEVVAMTGDGVNDALALKQADIGIVVGESSDVAVQTADMVLLDSNFTTIVHAIEEGRRIFENIRKVVLYLLSDSFMEIILVGGSMLLGLPLPVTAGQILWINLAEDTFPGMALAFEGKEEDLMREKPRQKDLPIFDKNLLGVVIIVGILNSVVLLFLFLAMIKGLILFHNIQSVMFVALGINSLFCVYACRSWRRPFWKFSLFDNSFLNLAVLTGILILAAGVYLPGLQTLLKTQPLGGREWLFLLILGIFNFLAIEVSKWFLIRPEKLELIKEK